MLKKHYKLKLILFGTIIILFHNCWAQNITKGPYLADPSPNSISIRWEVDSKTDGKVVFGLNDSFDLSQEAELVGQKNDHFLYNARLTEIQHSVRYHYKIICGKTKSAVNSFETMNSSSKDLRFVAMGDSRSNHDIFRAIVEQVNGVDPDLIISMGDLVETGGKYSQWGPHFFTPASDLLDHKMFISTLGDHETGGDNGELFRHFLVPDEKVDELWFSFDYGSAHFISLDYRHPENGKMIEWFKQDITNSKAKWNFVFMHRPCYNLGGHRTAWGRGTWPELFRKYKVDLVFAGHSHQYERFHPMRPQNMKNSHPVTYITTGGAGAGLYEVVQHAFLAKAESVNHFMSFEISGNTLNCNVYLNDGSMLDQFKIVKKKSLYNSEYLAEVISQGDVDIYTMFARKISFGIDMLPMDDVPVIVNLSLKSINSFEDVPFEISLLPECTEYYSMEAVSGVLNKNSKLDVPLKVFRHAPIKISQWGNITPALRLIVKYKTTSGIEEIIGGAVEYWPED